jgi:hypothetical protein
MSDKPDTKGKLNGECNRTACKNTPAVYFSTIEKAHYCAKCAREINQWIPDHLSKLEIRTGLQLANETARIWR